MRQRSSTNDGGDSPHQAWAGSWQGLGGAQKCVCTFECFCTLSAPSHVCSSMHKPVLAPLCWLAPPLLMSDCSAGPSHRRAPAAAHGSDAAPSPCPGPRPGASQGASLRGLIRRIAQGAQDACSA